MAWDIDHAHSLVEFSVKHMMVTTVKGRFRKIDGIFDLDEQDHAASKIDINIDANSIDTGDEKRDGHLRSPDFLDVQRFPVISYKSSSITADGNGKYTVRGNLTIREITREVPLDVTMEGQFKDLQGRGTYAFSATTAINRKDFDLTWNVALETGGVLVGEQVKIAIEVQVKAPTTVTA